MWKCLNCGAKFEGPLVIHTVDGVETHCPECGIDDIEELHLCNCEREYITDEQDRCQQCEKDIREIISEAKQKIMDRCNVDYNQATQDAVWGLESEG